MTESFIGTAIRTYDGLGNFQQVDNSHGTVTGQRPMSVDRDVYRECRCSGTSTLMIPGAPPIDTAFVIVDQGNLVNDIVMAPQANLVTAVLRRVGG